MDTTEVQRVTKGVNSFFHLIKKQPFGTLSLIIHLHVLYKQVRVSTVQLAEIRKRDHVSARTQQEAELLPQISSLFRIIHANIWRSTCFMLCDRKVLVGLHRSLFHRETNWLPRE